MAVDPKFANVLSVRDFGAKADGSDDRSAIQDAIAALPLTGSVLYFPSGVYVSSGPVYISNKSNFVILGYGATIKIQDNAPYYNNNLKAQYPISYGGDDPNGPKEPRYFSNLEIFNCSDWQVFGLTLDGNYATRGHPVAIAPNNGAVRDGNKATVTITTTLPHGLCVGEAVAITGVSASPISFNGEFTIAAAPSATTFTYTQKGPDATSGSGTATDASEWNHGIQISGCHRFVVQSVGLQYCQGDGINLSPINNVGVDAKTKEPLFRDPQDSATIAKKPTSNCSEFELRDVKVHNVARASIVVGGATNGIIDGLIDYEIGWDEDHSAGSNAGIHFEVDGGEDYARCEGITIANVRCRNHGINQGSLLHLSRKARSISMTNFVFEQTEVPIPQAIRPASNGWTIVEIGADHRPDSSLPPEPAIVHDITLSNGTIRIDRRILPHLHSMDQSCTGIMLETGFIPNTDPNSKTGAFDKAKLPQEPPPLPGDAIFVQENTGPALNVLDKDGKWVPFPTSGVNWTSPYNIAVQAVVIDGPDVGILVARNASDIRIENNIVRNTSKYSLWLLGECTVVGNHLLDIVGDNKNGTGIYDRNGPEASAFIRVGDQASSWDDPLPITDIISCENNIMRYGITDAPPNGLMYFSLDSEVTGFSANRNQCEGLFELDWNIFNGAPRSFLENTFLGNSKFGNFGNDGFSGELRWERQALNGSIGNKNITQFANLVVLPKNVEAAKLVRDHGLYVLSILPHRMILVTTIDQFQVATGNEVFGYLLQ